MKGENGEKSDANPEGDATAGGLKGCRGEGGVEAFDAFSVRMRKSSLWRG